MLQLQLTVMTCMRCVQDTAVILGREQARLQEELELVRRQVAQLAHVMQVTYLKPIGSSHV